MKVKNVREWAVEVAVTGQIVEAGETVEVPDDLGENLCSQPANWQAVTTNKKKQEGR